MVTIFENIYSSNPHYISVDKALARIKNGNSKSKIDRIRQTLDTARADALKKQLPSVCFAGKFGNERTDESLIEHSGFICMDFDKVNDIGEKMAELTAHDFTYAAWVSPRGNGIKTLVKIADGAKHREHFEALKEIFPDTDPTSINPSRVCFESFDENIFINKKAKHFTKTKKTEKIEVREYLDGDSEKFTRLLKWLSNRNDAFVTGERNIFIFKLAAACCRFGMAEESASNLILSEFQTSNDFTQKECTRAIKSAYKANRGKSGTASFDRDVLVDKVTRSEVHIDMDIYDESIRPKDVVYGEDVKAKALDIYLNGYESVKGIGAKDFDELFKPRKGEHTLWTGHGNYGKSQMKKWYQVFRAVLYGEKFATFPPEDYPIHNFYHDLVEILLGCDCSAKNPLKPNIEVYNNAYDFISKHFFYIYPTSLAPTPAYMKERFLELIIKEGVDGCDIDPFNQMTNDYSSAGGRSDKYLETVLADFGRFAQTNNVYMWIVAHPTKMKLGPDGNYPVPNVYDVSDGAMWNNKMDNIVVYHRPYMQTDPDNPLCEFHTKKIRNQKIVGKKGFVLYEYIRSARRFEFGGVDYLTRALKERGLNFKNEQVELSYGPIDITF